MTTPFGAGETRGTVRTSSAGCSAEYVGPEGDIIEPFDGRHDTVDIYRPDFKRMQTVCKCPQGREPRYDDASALRDAVERALAKGQNWIKT